MPAQFGMIGLGTMGRNLVLNIADHGIAVCGYDKNPEQQKILMDASSGKPVKVAASMKEFAESLSTPRRIMMLVPAGKIVDAIIDEALPFLQPGDILIDGGNSHFTDTDTRIERLKTTGIHFTGMGISGGEDGARFGPSMMPGGSLTGYTELKNILEKIAAQTDDGPCVAFIGNGSAGHYTKMVHNGIEYAIMQLISEIYGLLRTAGLSNNDIQNIFSEWNRSELQSFLIEITVIVLNKKDDATGNLLIDLVLDKAKQKGTGMWTSQSAMELNVPVPVIDAAVSMRYISSMKEDRVKLAEEYNIKKATITNATSLIPFCKNALHFSFLLSYAQGLHLLKEASMAYKYEIDIAEVLRIWKGGCIIRSVLLNDLRNAFLEDKTLENIIHSPFFRSSLTNLRNDVSSLVKIAIENQIPVTGLSASLNYFDAMCTAQLPANLIQAQRDYFGAHTYERIDKPGTFHTQWD